MVCRGRVIRARQRNNSAGFTLFEILAALAVIGVATGIFASLFIASMNMAHLNQSHAVAASLAEDQLLLVRENPSGFVWPDAAAISDGAFAAVTLKDPADRALSATQRPSVMPFDQGANLRERNFYEQFTWEAFARLPEADSSYVELAVAVRWDEKGKPQSVTLTSAVPRTILEAGS